MRHRSRGEGLGAYARAAVMFCAFVPLPLCSSHGCAAQSQSTPDAAARAEIATISGALRSRDYALAERLCQTAVAQHPKDPRFWTLRGMAAAGLGNSPTALRHYQKALALAPAYLPALEGAAQTAFQIGDASAKPTLLKILERRPEDPVTNAMLGTVAFRERHCDEAVAHFEKASQAIAGQRDALTQYGMCLSMLGRNADAVAPFSSALAAEPSSSDARYNVALAQWNAHASDEALSTLEPLLESDKANVDALTLAAEIHESKNETAATVELLRKAILARPRDVDAYLQFAMVSYDHASPQVGVDIVNAGLTQLPKEPRLYLVRGVLLTQLGEFTRAADDFETASHLDPKLHFLAAAQGIVQSQQHDEPRAIASFRAAVKAHPDEAYAHYLLAEALQGKSSTEGSPEFKEEIREAERALQLEPRMAAAHDLLAAVYVEFGRNQEAITHSRAALAIDPDDEQAVYHLILALRKTDDKSEVPALVKKLMELQRSSKSKSNAAKSFRLYEDSGRTSADK
ncbi:tetratricopeptide repeat protein [Occallatibacter riparius]|uniref:Tetratricopeptide repeat protein n=1 Tax=Occallatibacter riparius TaxID=1002689 RepID=A0A9J7BSZ9_9BACT|nr:tetratricopeptide repeat protein [Occallatibacter riparius]UWZ84141.1 tetratricopeptide repeat protein [Occallatibacter riparius]